MKALATLAVLGFVLLALFACRTPAPAGTYAQDQVSQGLSDAVDDHTISQRQADAVAGKIANAKTGFPWDKVLDGALSVAGSLGLGYIGIRTASNKHLIGNDEAAALDELVASKKTT